MLKTIRRYRSHLVAASMAALLGVAAHSSTLGLGTLILCTPVDVVAGNPIDGYADGIDGVCVINGAIFGFGMLGEPVIGLTSPLHFSYPTHEYQAPGVAIIHAKDADSSATKSVILK
jgi:hypothetical protein